MIRKTSRQTAKDKTDADLDEALEETFPASDPPAITEPSTGNRVAKAPANQRRPRSSPRKPKRR